MKKRDAPALEDGFPMPAPGRKREKPVKKGSRWTEMIKAAKAGQSVRIPWFQMEGLKCQARKMGVDMRHQHDGDIIYENYPLSPQRARAARVWFVNQYQQHEIMVESNSHWEDDPEYPGADWQEEVAAGNTRLGYTEWIAHRKEADADEKRQYTLTFKERTERIVTLYCSGDNPKKATEAGYDIWCGMSPEEKSKCSEEADLARSGQDIQFTVANSDGDEFIFFESDLGDGEPYQGGDDE